jgi:hypothetical protein
MFKPKLEAITKIALERNYPIFRSNRKFDYNLNIWGFRSPSENTKEYNDSCAVFWQDHRGHWSIEYFEITTDPSDLLLEKPVNSSGTAILKEGHHTALWTLGYHKERPDHKALIQAKPCTVYRDNNRDNRINTNLPEDTGIFGINMHRASKVSNDRRIGLYSAGCQVHYDYDRYMKVFIPLVESCNYEGNTSFSYTLCLQSWFR